MQPGAHPTSPQSRWATGAHEPSPCPLCPAPALQPAIPAPRRPHMAAGGGAGWPLVPPWHDAGSGAGCASCSWCREGMRKAPRSPVQEDRRGLGHCVGSSSEAGNVDVTLASGEGKRKLINRHDAQLSPCRGAPEKGLHVGSYWGNPPTLNPRDGWRWKAAGLGRALLSQERGESGCSAGEGGLTAPGSRAESARKLPWT